MQNFLGIFNSLVAVYVVVLMMRQARSGLVDLFSSRNFFLVGFIVFQLTSASLTLWTGYTDALLCRDYARTGLIYTFMATTFLSLFLLFYRWGVPANALASRLRTRHRQAGPNSMLLLSAIFLIGAIFWRLVLSQIPVFGVLAMIVTVGLAGTAAALAAWVWAPRWGNPFVAVVAVIIIAGSLSLGVYGDFGRRNALSILIACLWGAHHGHWKHIGVRRAIAQIVPLTAGALVFIAAFTAGRKQSVTDSRLNFTDSIARLGEGDLGRGFLDMASGQAAAACSMWLIETRPDVFPYDTFHSFRYFVGHPVPRIIWDKKPLALGGEMPRQARVPGRDWNTFSFGPGVIGHIANDNPWLTLVPYAFGLAFLVRFMDQVVRLHPFNPFIVIPMGVALGDIMGVPRGEVGLFLSRAVIIMVASFVSMTVCASVLGMLGLSLATDETAPEDPVPDNPDKEPLYDSELAAAYGDQSR